MIQELQKKYAESDSRPVYTLTAPKPSKLDPYKHLIDMWLEESPYSAVRIHEKLMEQVCDCKYTIVRQYVATRKADLNEKAIVRFETMPGLQGQVDWSFFENYKVFENGGEQKCSLLLLLYYHKMPENSRLFKALIRCYNDASFQIGAVFYGKKLD